MNSQKQKVHNNNKNMTNKSSTSKAKGECPREKKDCENCEIQICPEESV